MTAVRRLISIACLALAAATLSAQQTETTTQTTTTTTVPTIEVSDASIKRLKDLDRILRCTLSKRPSDRPAASEVRLRLAAIAQPSVFRHRVTTRTFAAT